jgi:hypothetical protein
MGVGEKLSHNSKNLKRSVKNKVAFCRGKSIWSRDVVTDGLIPTTSLAPPSMFELN